MIHPFERIISGHETDEPDTPQASRRLVLKLAAGGAVAAVTAQAFGQRMTTLAIGEEGGRPGRPPVKTTKRLGEEGGGGAIIGPIPGKQGQIATYCRGFRTALKAGDVETAADNFKKLETATKSSKPKNPYKNLVTGYRKQLDTALTGKLNRADKDLAARKPIPAIKAYRAISRVDGFKQQDQAKAKLTEAAKLDGHDEALSEVQAQELYDTAAKAKVKNPDKLAIYEQVAKEYAQTPTGKKAGRQAKVLAERLKRNEAAAAELLKKARKAKGPTQVRLLQTIVSRYPDTSSGKTAAQMLPKRAPRPPRLGGGPIATTMALGEEG